MGSTPAGSTKATCGGNLAHVNFSKVIGEVAGFLDRENVRFALAGAFALHAYGLSRATSDLDFVTEATVRERLVAFLESLTGNIRFKQTATNLSVERPRTADRIVPRSDVLSLD